MANPKPELKIHDQTNILPRGRLIVVFGALAIALLIAFIDQQSIGVILPTIGHDLQSSSTITWAATSSLIANTAFQVLYGRLSDIFGRKVMLISCLLLLGLGDLLCSFAKTGKFCQNRWYLVSCTAFLHEMEMSFTDVPSFLVQRPPILCFPRPQRTKYWWNHGNEYDCGL